MYRLIPNEGWNKEEQQQIKNHTSFTSELFAYGFVVGRYMPTVFFVDFNDNGSKRIVGKNNNGQSASITIIVNK